MKRIITTLAFLLSACDDPDQADGEEDQTFRPCISDWEITEEAKIPCHMDVDKHTFYREIEAYGVDTYIDGNYCVAGKRYDKVEMGNIKCTWSISTQDCANTLYMGFVKNTPMPPTVYDKDACPYPRLNTDNGGGGGGGSGGGGGGGQQQQ